MNGSFMHIHIYGALRYSLDINQSGEKKIRIGIKPILAYCAPFLVMCEILCFVINTMLYIMVYRLMFWKVLPFAQNCKGVHF